MRYPTALMGLVVAMLLAGGEAEAKPVATDADCVALGRQIEGAMNRGDASVFDRAFDLDALVDRAVSGYDVDQNVKDGFRRGVKNAQRKNSFATQVLATMRKGGGYKFLRLQRADGECRLLFRLLTADGGLNYHSLRLGGAPPGGVKITDIYIYILGEPFSNTFRRAFLPIAYDSQRNVFEKMLGWESDFVKNLPKMQKMQALAKEKKPKEALQLYFELPATLQRDKTFLLMRTIYASDVGPKEYEEAMKAYQQSFPNDPSVDLVTLDAYVLNKKYGEAIQSINRVNASVGGDPYLAALRASMYLLDGKFGPARESAQKAVADDPTLADGYWALVSISLAEKNYKETARVLQLIERNLALTLGDLKKIPDYAGFVQSPEYRKWMNMRAKR